MKFEFIHDTIANVVSKKASADSKIRKQLRSMVERAHQRYLDKGILLTKDDLEEIRPFQNQIDFSEAETKFIKKSRQVLSRKRRRNQFLIAAFITALIIALLLVLRAQRKAVASEQTALAANEGLHTANANLDQKIKELNQTNTSLSEARANLLAREDSLRIAVDLAKKNERTALKAKNEALFQKSRALKGENIAEARRIASLAQLIGREGKLNDALKMCVVAAQKTPTIQPEVYQALQGVWLEDEEQKVPILDEKNSFKIPYTYRVALSPTGDTLAVSLFGNITQLRSKEGKVLRNFPEMTSLIDEPIFSPNGQFLFAKSLEGNCYLWSFKENRLLVDIPAVQGALHRQAFFTADSKKLALTKGADILLYDVEKGKLITSLNANSSDIILISFSPDGKRLLSSDNQGGWMLWDVEKQELIKHEKMPSESAIRALRFSPDGQTFTLAANKMIYQYSSEGDDINENWTDYSNVDDIQYSKDGKHLAVLLDYGAILLFSSDLKDKRKISKFISTEEILFSKNGDYLWVNGYKGTFKINLKGDEIFAVPQKPFLGYNLISPQENYVLSIDEKGEYSFWEPKPSPVQKMLAENKTSNELTLYSPTFGVDERQLFFNTGGQLYFWEEGKGWKDSFYPKDTYNSVTSYHKENNSILTAADSTLIWMEVDGSVKHKFFHPCFVVNAQFNPSYKKIVSTCDSVIYIWNTSGKLLETISSPEHILGTDILENDYLLTQTENGKVFLRDEKGNLINNWTVENEDSLLLYVPPTLDYFLIVEQEKTLSICNLRGQVTKQIDIKGQGYIAIKFSEDGRYFLIHDINSTISFWNKNGNNLWTKTIEGKDVFYTKIFKEKSQLLVTFSDGVIHILDLKGRLLQEWVGHKNALYDFVYSKDGSKVLTCSSDKVAKLWTKDGQLLADFVGHKNRVHHVLFSPDEKWVLTTSADGSAIKWPMPSTYIEWIENLKLPPFTKEEKRFFGID